MIYVSYMPQVHSTNEFMASYCQKSNTNLLIFYDPCLFLLHLPTKYHKMFDSEIAF